MIISELIKQAKLIFRNWSTLLLIILAPLLLIILVGYAFSSEDLHNIHIGIIGEFNTSSLSQSLKSSGDVIAYAELTDCLIAMQEERIHLCIAVEGPLEKKSSTTQVTFYYDNSRKRISLLLLSQLKDYFGLTSEKISLLSTTEIFSKVNELVQFLNERIIDIDQAQNQTHTIREDLVLRKQKLIEFNKSFTPRYVAFSSINNRIQTYHRSVNQSEQDFAQSVSKLYASTADLHQALALLPKQVNATLIDSINASLNNVEQQLEAFNQSTSKLVNQIDGAVLSLNQMSRELAQVNSLIAEEIEQTDYYLALINKSAERLEAISKEAHQRSQNLQMIDPALAQSIAKPITQGFVPLLETLTSIQSAFPTLLATIIVFISTLFANILTLLEITNKAYIRNILAPVNDFLFTSGIAITNTLIVFVQVIALLIVAQLQFGIPILSHLGSLLIPIFILIVMFTCVGMILAYFAKSIQSSILLATFTALGFFLLSDALVALEAMPPPAAAVAKYNPLVLSSFVLRQQLFFDSGSISPTLYILAGYLGLSIVLLLWISKRKNKQRF